MLLEGIETLLTHGTHGPFGELNFGPLGWKINVVWDVYILIHHALITPLRIRKSKSVSVYALKYLGWDTRVSNRQCTWLIGFLRRESTGQTFFYGCLFRFVAHIWKFKCGIHTGVVSIYKWKDKCIIHI